MNQVNHYFCSVKLTTTLFSLSSHQSIQQVFSPLPPALNQTGTATVSVQIKDNGGTLNGGMDASEVQTFTITINGLPAAPTATATQNFCGSAVMANLSANAPAGSTVSWYSSMSLVHNWPVLPL